METDRSAPARVSYIETAWPGTPCDLCPRRVAWVSHYLIDGGPREKYAVREIWAHRACMAQLLESTYPIHKWEGGQTIMGMPIERPETGEGLSG